MQTNKDELRKKAYRFLFGIYLGEDADGNDYFLDPNENMESLDELTRLINSEVLSVLERLEKKQVQLHDEVTDIRLQAIGLGHITAEKKRYKS